MSDVVAARRAQEAAAAALVEEAQALLGENDTVSSATENATAVDAPCSDDESAGARSAEVSQERSNKLSSLRLLSSRRKAVLIMIRTSSKEISRICRSS